MITEEDFVKLMQYPQVWLEWNMLPKIVVENQLREYQPGDERGSEHYRNSAFQFWLRGPATEEQLLKLVKLTTLDPETIMEKYIREKDIPKCENFTHKVAALINEVSF